MCTGKSPRYALEKLPNEPKKFACNQVCRDRRLKSSSVWLTLNAVLMKEYFYPSYLKFSSQSLTNNLYFFVTPCVLLSVFLSSGFIYFVELFVVKEEVTRKFPVISKPKNICLSAETTKQLSSYKLLPQCNKTVD